MEWFGLFGSHIIDRGIMYCEGGAIKEFNVIDDKRIEGIVKGSKDYHVVIDYDGEDIISMSCTCPHAESGANCKHMAAVLFKYEDYLEDKKGDFWALPEEEAVVDNYMESFRNEAEDLVSRIPVPVLKEMMVGYVLADEGLRNRLLIEYSNRFDARQMTALKDEIRNIRYSHSDQRGFVDWYHASDFTSGLVYFLSTKVEILITKGYLQQAFELTSLVFRCIGTVDMDDSDGGSEYVAHKVYECWTKIYDKCNENDKARIKEWFNERKDDFVVDYLQDYLNEFLEDVLCDDDELRNHIKQMDEILQSHKLENCSPKVYSVSKGYEDVLLKRIGYMEKLGSSSSEINSFKKDNRHFFIVREMEIDDAIGVKDYKTAESVLIESKKLDENYPEQLKKYSRLLIQIFEEQNDLDKLKEELTYQLLECQQSDTQYFDKYKNIFGGDEAWNKKVDKILSHQINVYFVCDVMLMEGRIEDLMSKIERSESISLLDKYENVLKEQLPERVASLYRKHLLVEVERASDRNDYRYLIDYLRKLASFPMGRDIAMHLADQWKVEFRRRPAMMDEMRRSGF